MPVIHMSLANFSVADLFCSTAIDMSFERGCVVDYATSWDMHDEEEMERVRDEESVLLPNELTRATGKLSEGKCDAKDT